jgi:hypothetical protein
MMHDPFPTPTRREQRGKFPEHSPYPGAGALPAREAAERARTNLVVWIENHPGARRAD